MNQEIEVRKGELGDAEDIAGILRRLGWFPWIEEKTAEEVAKQVYDQMTQCEEDDSHDVFVAVTGDGVVGYLAVHWNPYLLMPGREGYISDLFIDSGYRGRGVGAQLIEVVKGEAVRRGCMRLSLLNIRDRESYQRDFYRKQGFHEREDAAVFVLYF